ncbi:MAG TPA: family 20 glycosylhydrolase [Terriglobales bacterium]|nr:family 20 glycosylhydrolase [Terriglobales bacterium]
MTKNFACVTSIILSLIFFLILPAATFAREYHLMPQPARLLPGNGRLMIDGSFRVSLVGYQEPRLQIAAARFIKQLSLQTGIPINDALAQSPSAALIIHCDHAGEPVQSVRENESYSLHISPTQAILSAPTTVGALRGMATFKQLVEFDGTGVSVPALVIEDQPRFPWRGLMVDVSRRWIPPPLIKRNLDAMAAVKMNVLHWHLTDDQGFRIESLKFPKLQQMGSDGKYYTQDEVRDIVAYARDRGIRVVPEFDMPGHTGSWFVGYPELASAPGPFSMERNLGIRDAAMDPTRETVYQFLDEFMGEISRLFPDEYFHIGGDEVNGKQWKANPRIQAFMRAHNMKDHHDLQAYFNQRLLRIVQKHGKKMVGWDEVLHPDLPKDIVVQSWRGQQSLANAARGGYMGILSTGYYLDLMEPASASYKVDPLGAEAASLTPEEKKKVLGGEACVWTENIDAQTFDSANWPRTAAIAERLWSPAEVQDSDSMYRRLEFVSRQLEWLGLTQRASSRMMLERLAGDADPAPLIALDAVLVPLNCDTRREVHPYTSLTPLNRLVDATPPESDGARELAKLVSDWQANKELVRQRLSFLRDNHTHVLSVMQSSALLQEAIPLAENVAALATAGLEALDYLDRHQAPPAEWVTKQNALLQKAAKPHAELLIGIADPVSRLVSAAQNSTK